MLYRSRISRSRLTGSNCFGASIMFFTSGRPTRSIRTLNLPRVSVSATTPTSAAPPRSVACRSRRRGSARSCRRGRSTPGSVNASFPVAIVFSAAGASMMNGSQRGPAKTRTPCPEPPSSSFDPERDRLAGRRGAGALLLGAAPVAPSRRVGEDAVDDELLGRRRRTAPVAVRRVRGQRAQPEAVDEPVGEQRPTAGRTAACSSPAPGVRAAPGSGTRRRR